MNNRKGIAKLRREDKADPMVIACAEKYNKMLLDMREALYGKEAMIKDVVETSLEELSDRELLKLLKQ